MNYTNESGIMSSELFRSPITVENKWFRNNFSSLFTSKSTKRLYHLSIVTLTELKKSLVYLIYPSFKFTQIDNAFYGVRLSVYPLHR
jgi:hypothetical protein